MNPAFRYQKHPSIQRTWRWGVPACRKPRFSGIFITFAGNSPLVDGNSSKLPRSFHQSQKLFSKSR
ncbi:MAG TPA: hypothetical protein VLB04_02495, partial [Methanotrichaceae archaeon]|nr:hypothetical protein [Methanotrichaceae archaeon]